MLCLIRQRKKELIIEKVHGKLTALKKNQIKKLSNLYRRRIDPKMAVNRELARALAELSLETKKSISVLIDRRGRVITVSLGDAIETPLPALHGEAEQRLYGLRLVHTHLKEGGLSPDDLSKLFLNRLDAIVAIDIDEKQGRAVVNNVHLAQISPPTADEEDWIIQPAMSIVDLEKIDILELTRALEAELARSYNAREVKKTSQERAVLIALETGEGIWEAESRLDELVELAKTAGAVIAHKSMQQRPKQDPKFYIGKGKLQELVSKSYHEDADMLIFDRELNPSQAREIEKETQLKIIDRTQLILDIFAQNARGREAQVQVELAQLNYRLTRLTGRGSSMDRLAGGAGGGGGAAGAIGTRGPGETKLEIDRRRIREKITVLEKAVKEISQRRQESRKSRTKSSTPVIALVGYTNAGKSSLFNKLAKSQVLSQNKLFATLRPTTREGWLDGIGDWGKKVLYTDTVGFIRDLPDELINAFRATLEELHDADLLLHLIDASEPAVSERVKAVEKILEDLEIKIPKIVVINKLDISRISLVSELQLRYNAIAVSAKTGTGIPELKLELARKLEPDNFSNYKRNQAIA